MEADPRVLGEGGRGQPESTSPGWSPEHGGAEATERCRGNQEARLLTRRARGHGEADAEDRRSRRVGVLPESVAEVVAAARARRRNAAAALQCTRASKFGVRRRTETRGSELCKREGQRLTGVAGIGEETRRQQRTPAGKCGSLAARCDGGAEGKWRGGNGLYSHADA